MIIFILAKVPLLEPITENKIGEQLAMVSIDLMSIKNIVACPETGNGIINYKMPTEPLETSIPFQSLFSTFYNQGILDTSLLSQVRDISSTFNQYINITHGL